MDAHPARTGATTTGAEVTTSPEIVILHGTMRPRSDPRAASTAGGLADPGERIDVDDVSPVLFGDDATERYAVCTECRERKLVAEFSRNTYKRNGRQSYCRDCGRARRRRGWGIAAAAASLSPPEGERCAICSGEGGKRGLFLDHDHANGRVRGWLCHNCNSAIGHLNDDPFLLERAVRYLRMDDAS